MKTRKSPDSGKYMLITHNRMFFADKIKHFLKFRNGKYHLDSMNPENQHYFRYASLYTCRDGKIIRIKQNGTECE